MSEQKQPWEMSYDEMYKAWASKYNFGAKGELTLSEAREVHNKWKRLGTLARRGVL